MPRTRLARSRFFDGRHDVHACRLQRWSKTEYHEAGADYYELRYRERLLNSLKKKATELGFNLTPIQEVH